MTQSVEQAAQVPGRVIEDVTVQPAEHWARVVPQGSRVRFIDLEGKQAIDFLAYNAHDPSERYNAADTMKYAGTIFLTKGHGIYTDMGRKLFTIVEDTCGRHDTIGGCCSAESNQLRYTDANTPNCRDTFPQGPSRARPRQEGHRSQPQLLHERPRRAGRRHGPSRRLLPTRRPHRTPSRNGHPSRSLQLPPNPQPRQRLHPHPHPHHRVEALAGRANPLNGRPYTHYLSKLLRCLLCDLGHVIKPQLERPRRTWMSAAHQAPTPLNWRKSTKQLRIPLFGKQSTPASDGRSEH